MLSLPALLADPARAVDVPADTVPSLLAMIAAEQARLAAVQGALAARLTVSPTPANDRHEHDVINDVHEVARITRHSVSWVRKNGHRLPSFSQPGGKGTRVAWSRRGLEAWASSPTK